jgi:hypothetical protein
MPVKADKDGASLSTPPTIVMYVDQEDQAATQSHAGDGDGDGAIGKQSSNEEGAFHSPPHPKPTKTAAAAVEMEPVNTGPDTAGHREVEAAAASVLAHNDVAAAPPLLFDVSSSSSSEDEESADKATVPSAASLDPVVSASGGGEGGDGREGGEVDGTVSSASGGKDHAQEAEEEVDIDTALENGSRGQLDFEFVGGGLGRCLLEMDSLATSFQKRCSQYSNSHRSVSIFL